MTSSPLFRGLRFLSSALVALAVLSALQAARPPGSGIAFTWPDSAFPGAEDASVVKVRQSVMDWSDIAPGSASQASNYANYDWSILMADVNAATANGQKIMLQVNAGAPSWVFNTVAQVGFSRGEKAPQFWDPAYVTDYKTMITALANKIKSLTAAQRALFIGVRMQPNAFNTEVSTWDDIPADEIGTNVNTSMPIITDGSGNRIGDRSKWILGDGSFFGPDLNDIKSGTTTYEQDYLKQIIDQFYTQFTTGVLASPNGIYSGLREADLTKHLGTSYLDTRFNLTYTMSLDTGCEAQVLFGTSFERSRYDYIDNRCRTEGGRGYWEDYKESSYDNGSTHRPVNLNPNQEFYWRQLIKLDAGACYGAVYGADLVEWNAGTAGYPAGISFFNKYAGHLNDPANSPGAWVAFVDVPAAAPSPARPQLGFFISHLNSTASGVTNPQNVGSGVNYQGMYARRFGAGGVAKFSVLPAYANTIPTGYRVIVTWYSPTSDANWFFSIRNGTGGLVHIGGNVTGSTSGWTTKTFNPSQIPAGGGTTSAPDFTITNVGGNAYFHLIEISNQ